MKKLLALLLILTFPILGTADYSSKKWAIKERVEKNNIPFLIALSCPHDSYYKRYSEEDPSGEHYILLNNKVEINGQVKEYQSFVSRVIKHSCVAGDCFGSKLFYYKQEWAGLITLDSKYLWEEDPSSSWGSTKYSLNRKTLKLTVDRGSYIEPAYGLLSPYDKGKWTSEYSVEIQCKVVDLEETINHIENDREKNELLQKKYNEERSKKAQEGNQI